MGAGRFVRAPECCSVGSARPTRHNALPELSAAGVRLYLSRHRQESRPGSRDGSRLRPVGLQPLEPPVVKLHSRLLGVVFIAAAGASTLAHRTVYEAARHGPAQAAELGLALLTFMLASTGILLLINGAKVFGREWECRARAGKPTRRDLHALFTAPVTFAGLFYDTKYGVSLMKARHGVKGAKRFDDRQLSTVSAPLESSRRSRSIAPRR